MRAALISLAGSQYPIAGRSIALRQLDFALAAGCTRVFAVGDGASVEALGLGHAAERAGARFQTLRDARGLLGALPASDELLVLAPGLLPEAPQALAALSAPAVLVLPAAPGVAAGFERIDLERASAGAFLLPGGLLERLAELAPDSEPAPALLRIALQARVREHRLPEAALADGSWALATEAAAAEAVSGRWLARHAPPMERYAFADCLAQAVIKSFAARWLAAPRASAGFGAASVALQAGAVGLCGWLSVPAGFLALAMGLLCGAIAERLGALAAAPFGKPRGRWTWLRSVLGDVALAACGGLAIWGTTIHRLFPPLMLSGLLRSTRASEWPNATALFGDRVVLALLFAVAALFDHTEEAIMLAALAILLVQVIRSAGRSG